MPGTGVGDLIVAGATAFFTGTGVAANIARAVALIATANVIAKKQAAFDPGLQGRQLTARGSTEPYKLGYGTFVVSGPLMFPSQALGPKNRELWNGIALLAHEVNAITDVWLDQRLISNSEINSGNPAGGVVNSGDFRARFGQDVLRINKHLGTPTQAADADLVAAWSDWTSAHQAKGVAYLVTMFVLFDKVEDLWESGEPRNIRALVEGKHVYDPRLDTSPGANPEDAAYWSFNANPVLHCADRLRGAPDKGQDVGIWGLGFDPSRFDWDQVASEADYCDVVVSVPGGTQPRFESNGVLFGTEQPVEHVAAILASCAGSLSLVGDKFVIRTNQYEAPTVALSESDLLTGVGLKQSLSTGQRFNHAKGTYIDPDEDWQPNVTAPNTVTGYQARDGGEYLEESFEYTMVTDRYQAQRLNIHALRDANESLNAKATFGWPGAELVAGARFTLDGVVGWTSKVFRVEEWSISESGEEEWGVELAFREDSAAAHADPAVGDYNTTTAAGALVVNEAGPVPSPGTVPPGIAYGDAATNIVMTPNQNGAGAADDGEVRLEAGDLTLADGTIRSLTSNSAVRTPWEGANTPPDSYFYIISGNVDPSVRFGGSQSNWGDGDAPADGFFGATYDRTTDTWYATRNDFAGGEPVRVSFTPLASDVVIGRGRKTSTSGGIDEFASVVPFVTDPTLQSGAGTGLAVEQHQDQLSSAGVASVTHTHRGEFVLIEVRGPLIGNASADNSGQKNLRLRRGTTVLATLTFQASYEDLGGGTWLWTGNASGSALISYTENPGAGNHNYNTTWDGDNMTQPPTLTTREEYEV